jgi:predicted negative regulator of RcsB-dependent stress response
MNTEPTPAEETPAKTAQLPASEINDVEDAVDFLKENGVAIVVGVAIAVAAFVGYSMWQKSKAARIDTASTLLANSQTAPQFQEIINNYGDTPASALAYLSLGSAYFDQGQFDLARQTFAQFQTTYPDHNLLPIADIGIAQAQESAGGLQEALASYDAFITKYPDHYLKSTAVFGKARVLEAMNNYSEARTVYEDYIASNPDSRWISRAETGLEFVNKQERAAQKAAVAPTVVPVVEPVVIPAVEPTAEAN